MIVDATCPGCSKDHQVEVDLASIPKAKRVQLQDIEAVDFGLDSKIEAALKKMQPPKEEKPVKQLPPLSSYIPRFKCKDGNCEVGNHKNPNYKKLPKSKCTNCDQFNPHEKGKCLWCDSEDLEKLEIEDLESLNIPAPSVPEEHDHE